jgi:hypothetical protein
MTAGNKGLLLVMMEPPASLEEEFNDWYDTEHLPQRRALPGFESAARYVCVAGWPKWLALYDLASLRALETAEYLAVSGANSTPWSKRILPRTAGRSRIVAEQISPGSQLSCPTDEMSSMLLARYRGGEPSELTAALKKAARGLSGFIQLRFFRSAGPASPDLWLIAAFGQPVTQAMLQGPLAGSGSNIVRLFNLYVPYHRG